MQLVSNRLYQILLKWELDQSQQAELIGKFQIHGVIVLMTLDIFQRLV